MKKLEIIRTYYESKMDRGLPDYGVLGWESKEAQTLRFDILLSSVDLGGRSLLDVGCGMGNLPEYIRSKGMDVRYTGVDILQSMVDQARARMPGAEFYNADIFAGPFFGKRIFDVVYASGIFNLNLGNNRDFLCSALDTMLGLSMEAVVFNLLHRDSPDREEKYSYFHPDEIKSIVECMSGRVKKLNIVEAYLKNDFTAICIK